MRWHSTLVIINQSRCYYAVMVQGNAVTAAGIFADILRTLHH